MRCTTLRKAYVLGVGLYLTSILPQSARSASVNFNSAGDLANFNQADASNPPAPSLTLEHSATAGTSGSGGVVVTAVVANQEDTTAVYAPESFNLTTGLQHTVTVDFKTGTVTDGGFTGGNNAVAMVGFTGENNTGFYNVNPAGGSSNFIGGRIRHEATDFLQAQRKSGTSLVSAGNPGDITFLSNNWYRLSFSVTRDATVGQFSYSMSVQDIGANGAATPTAITNGTLAGIFTGVSADLYDDPSLYAAFRNVPAIGGGPVAFDNFTALAAIPEPAGAVLLGVGALGLLRRRPVA